VKIEIAIKPDLKESHVVVYTNEVTDEVQNIVDRLSNLQTKIITGTQDKKIYLIDYDEIYCFYSENQKIFAKTDKGNFCVKQRLYELEEMLTGSSFLRISNSCIVNMDKVKNLDISYSGSIDIVFKNESKEFASRRYISKIKKYLGI
jgi:DNA-binding LytR/AlgR family response regulator